MQNPIVPQHNPSQAYNFGPENDSIRGVPGQDGECWFVAYDLARILGYMDESDAVSRHCKHQKPLTELANQLNLIPSGAGYSGLPGNTLCVPESDLYRLIMGSKLDSAARFGDWIFEEVLPTLRRTGSYSMTGADRGGQELAA